MKKIIFIAMLAYNISHAQTIPEHYDSIAPTYEMDLSVSETEGIFMFFKKAKNRIIIIARPYGYGKCIRHNSKLIITFEDGKVWTLHNDVDENCRRMFVVVLHDSMLDRAIGKKALGKDLVKVLKDKKIKSIMIFSSKTLRSDNMALSHNLTDYQSEQIRRVISFYDTASF